MSSQQGDAFVRRVLKGDPAPVAFRDVVQYFRQRGGSGRGAARLAGTSESTFRRWAAGAQPQPRTVQRVTEAYRSARSAPSRMGDPGVMMPIVSQDRKRGSRERDVSGVQLKLAPGTLDAAHKVWVQTGDADAAARRFWAGIGDPWYKANLAKALGVDPDQRPAPAGGAAGPTAGGGGGGGGGGAAGGGGDSWAFDEVSGPEFDEYVLEGDYGMSIG